MIGETLRVFIFLIKSFFFAATIALFTLPKVYEMYQEPIDRYLAVAQAGVNNLINAGFVLSCSLLCKTHTF
jgi:hypothetical protein